MWNLRTREHFWKSRARRCQNQPLVSSLFSDLLSISSAIWIIFGLYLCFHEQDMLDHCYILITNKKSLTQTFSLSSNGDPSMPKYFRYSSSICKQVGLKASRQQKYLITGSSSRWVRWSSAKEFQRGEIWKLCFTTVSSSAKLINLTQTLFEY